MVFHHTLFQYPLLLLALFQHAPQVDAQAGPPVALEQVNTYASPLGSASHNQAADVIAASGVNPQVAAAVQVAVDFERSNWATGSVLDDPFYIIPSNASGALPGSILKVQQDANATDFTLPPQVAISRFIFQTEDLNGTCVPNSAFVLWPWMPRRFDNVSGVPVIVWGHGTSGISVEAGPSHMQDLWYQYASPFTLALQGYAVIAPDFAGLGINKTAGGEFVPHQWGANPAGANDMFYAVQAAQQAWPTELSEEFVIMGHSQGGGVAWSSAVRQAQKSVAGYLGTVAVSPLTDFSGFAQLPTLQVSPNLVRLAPTLLSIFPEFQLSDWLSPAGVQASQLYQDLSGAQSVYTEVTGTRGVNYAQSNWSESWYLDTFNKLVSVDGHPIAGPMLVLQGTADTVVPEMSTNAAINATCGKNPNSDIEYNIIEGADHVPTLFASQQIWLQWIADRFNRLPSQGSCTSQMISPFLSVPAYEKEVNFFLELPQYAYETGYD